jgi:hypothetical protein
MYAEASTRSVKKTDGEKEAGEAELTRFLFLSGSRDRYWYGNAPSVRRRRITANYCELPYGRRDGGAFRFGKYCLRRIGLASHMRPSIETKCFSSMSTLRISIHVANDANI